MNVIEFFQKEFFKLDINTQKGICYILIAVMIVIIFSVALKTWFFIGVMGVLFALISLTVGIILIVEP